MANLTEIITRKWPICEAREFRDAESEVITSAVLLLSLHSILSHQ